MSLVTIDRGGPLDDLSQVHAPKEMANVLYAVAVEREAQIKQWGGAKADDSNSPGEWVTYIVKQAGYIIMGRESDSVEQRFVKIAALAVAAVESLKRRRGRETA